MSTFITLPYSKLLIGLLCSIATLFLGSPIFIILFIITESIIISLSKDLKQVVIFYFMLSFLLPYDFVLLSTNSIIGNLFNEYFFAGLPLYLFLPVSLTFGKIRYRKYRTPAFVLLSSLIILLITNIFPGFASLFGIGGHHIRLIYLINFINALIIAYYILLLKPDKLFLQVFVKYIILFGFILAITGIFQYFTKISIVPNFKPENLDRLYTISYANSVDCLPFLLVPFVFSLVYVFNNRQFHLKYSIYFITIFLAILLTWSRWGIAVSLFIVLVSLFYLKTPKTYKVLFIIFLLLISPLGVTYYNSAIIKRNQQERLSSFDNLNVRMYLWGLGLTAISQSPVLGYGFKDHSEEMFKKDSEFNITEATKTYNVDYFTKQSVHQFILDYCLSLGVLFLIPLLTMVFYILKTSIRSFNIASYDLKAFYLSVFLSTLTLFLFWMQNQGSQIYFFYSFLAIMSTSRRLSNT